MDIKNTTSTRLKACSLSINPELSGFVDNEGYLHLNKTLEDCLLRKKIALELEEIYSPQPSVQNASLQAKKPKDVTSDRSRGIVIIGGNVASTQEWIIFLAKNRIATLEHIMNLGCVSKYSSDTHLEDYSPTEIPKDIIDCEVERGISLSRMPCKKGSYSLSLTMESNQIGCLQKVLEMFNCTLADPKLAIDKIKSFGLTLNSDLESLRLVNSAMAYEDSPLNKFATLERKHLQKQYATFHNAIYGNKFREAKHASKQTHAEVKQNTRRTRCNGMIKNRIHNYNKPATM